MTNETEGAAGRIVVGVDGSEPSREALRWALGQARLTGATVEAVTAWELPYTYGWDMVPPSGDDMQAGVAKMVQEEIAGVAGDPPDVPVRSRVVEGNAARVLLDSADGADLMVVGSRGHGGFAGVLLGSVSQHCVTHASCPVVVIRGRHTAPEGH